MPSASSAAAAAAIAINSTWFIPQFRKKRKTRFINTCAYVLGHRFSKSRLKLADIDFAVAVGVHELQGKGMSVGANHTNALYNLSSLQFSSRSIISKATIFKTHMHEFRNVCSRQPSLEQEETSPEFPTLQNTIFVLVELLKSRS